MVKKGKLSFFYFNTAHNVLLTPLPFHFSSLPHFIISLLNFFLLSFPPPQFCYFHSSFLRSLFLHNFDLFLPPPHS